MHKSIQGTTTIPPVTLDDIERLNAREAVEVFRDLLWCQARRQGVPISNVHITLEETADGGIDALVDDHALDEYDDLLSAKPCYQIKTGRTAKPWQASWIKKELFGKAKAEIHRSNLGEAVIRCLENNGRYVLICFGCSPTPEQIAQAREKMTTLFSMCGFDNSRVEVWGQEHIRGFISVYPSLSLKIMRSKFLAASQSHASWAQSEDMSYPLCLGEEQQQLIEEIRECIRGDDIRHVRLTGEPGLGKTRLVLEAMSAIDLASQIMYFPHAEGFQQSRLFHELLQPDNGYVAIFVIDECSAKECALIWNVLRQRSDRCRLITIDHERDDTNDDMMRVFNCPALPNVEIAAIIKQYVPSQQDIHRWVEFCSGSPGVAHVIGQNLKENPNDILKSPSTVRIWDRFLAGDESSDSSYAKERLKVLRYIALFHRFGFEPPVDKEAQSIANLAEIPWPEFQSIVIELKKRRILHGSRTLFITPKLLHIYLWLQFWEHYGRGFPLNEILRELPRDLCDWFIKMLPYAHASEVAVSQVESWLGRHGPFSDDRFIESQIGCKFLNVLTEAAPQAALSCIEQTIGTWDQLRLFNFKDGRQQIVWALEQIAVQPKLFCRAASLLLRLGEAENSHYSNNASGTFVSLFNIRIASTEASPSECFPALQAALESHAPKQYQLGLQACTAALSTGSSIRTVGAEYQGIRPTAELWRPKTWDEIIDAYRSVWQLLTQMRSIRQDEQRAEANNVLVTAANGLIRIAPLVEMVFDTLNDLVDDPATDLNNLVGFITHKLYYSREELDEDIISRIEALDHKITGINFDTKLRRFILLSEWDEAYDEQSNRSDAFKKRIESLAQEVMHTPTLLDPILTDLVSGTNSHIYTFGFHLGKFDSSQVCLKKIISAYHDYSESATALFLGGYLSYIFSSGQNEWESTIEQLIHNKNFSPLIGDLISYSGLTNNILEKIMNSVDTGSLPISTLLSCRYMHQLREIDEDNIITLVKQLITFQETNGALDIMNYFYCYNKNDIRKLPEELTLELLASEISLDNQRNTMTRYHWSVIANQFVAQYPDRCQDIFRASLEQLYRQHWFLGRPYRVIREVIKHEPESCWSIMTSMLGDLRNEMAGRIQDWLNLSMPTDDDNSASPLALFPVELILDWIAEAPETRARFIASVVPKTLDVNASGTLARELLNRYGDIEGIGRALLSRFWSGSWKGPDSEHYRRKIDEATGWLENETSARVLNWIEEYIEFLKHDITKAEIEEEREL